MPKPAAEINRWIRSQQDRPGIDCSSTNGGRASTVSVMLPSMAVVTRVAHAAADAKIAADPSYDAMCERLDAELAEILGGCVGLAAPRAKSTRRERVARVMTND